MDGLTTYNNELYKQIQLLELRQTTPEQAVADMKTQIEINLDADLVGIQVNHFPEKAVRTA